jgi:hypothetical protein
VIDQHFIFLALMFQISGTGIYVRKTLQGRVRPHVITWSLWALVPYIAFVAQLSEGVVLPAFVTLVTGVNPTCTLLAAVHGRTAHWSTSAFDLCCAVSAAGGVLLWATFADARYAIVFAILADALAAAPTFAKAYSRPQTESALPYACLAASSLITLASLASWTFASCSYAVYLAVLGGSLALTVFVRHRRVQVRSALAAHPLAVEDDRVSPRR